VHVTYDSTSFTGKPLVSYRDANDNESFTGNEIRVVESDLGTLISVTLRATADIETISLSLVIPNVQLTGVKDRVDVETFSITTTHRVGTRVHPAFGQLDTYSLTVLRGTAEYRIS
jgi:hypothetical protein